jgi:hypothetical protein
MNDNKYGVNTTNVVIACSNENCGGCSYKINGWCNLFNCAIVDNKLRCEACFRAEKELQ